LAANRRRVWRNCGPASIPCSISATAPNSSDRCTSAAAEAHKEENKLGCQIGLTIDLAHQVRGEEDGSSFGGQGTHELANPLHALGVEPVDRLVEDERPGVA
jgi:hypothetical protein